MPDPLDHIARTPLPWRTADQALTECGRPVTDVAAFVTREDAIARWKRDGAQRAAYTLCMTCVETTNRHGTWDDDPVGVMQREVAGWGRSPARDRMALELRALALLVAAHPDEWDETIAGLEGAPSLAAKRAERRQRGG